MTVLENVRAACSATWAPRSTSGRPEKSLNLLDARAVSPAGRSRPRASFADEQTVNLPYGRKRALELATTLAWSPS
jgi:branched-chain amino acid transport system ATP-binding protein